MGVFRERARRAYPQAKLGRLSWRNFKGTTSGIESDFRRLSTAGMTSNFVSRGSRKERNWRHHALPSSPYTEEEKIANFPAESHGNIPRLNLCTVSNIETSSERTQTKFVWEPLKTVIALLSVKPHKQRYAYLKPILPH